MKGLLEDIRQIRDGGGNIYYMVEILSKGLGWKH